ncbi:glycosyltransferase [Citrobacter freundii]|nr:MULTISPECIES: glycosyltransferase [Citrobacter]AYL57366.1 hypothetical protein CUC48_12765 [Citrobacter freundii]EJC6091261.1 glycosyltransferase [Citrobacter freundii]ELA7613055.1 glycosyltransferase [Citrobacter freundii]ELK1245908.1 glycosyltransferase [Citrobacter freundii]ELK6626746.1 glycosyltransferase [Citrobacter freundii]
MKILPIIVLYKCSLSESKSFNSLLTDNCKHDIREVFVYNNSPEINQVPEEYMGVKIHVVNDYNNSGVSRAYNSGLKVANKLGYEYVLLLDQDTLIPDSALDVYKKYLIKKPSYNLYCPILRTTKDVICSPLIYKFHRGFSVKDFTFGEYDLDKFSPINSGMLLNVRAALECGGYNEEVFLDFSDFQFIERFRTKNNKFYVIPVVFIQDFSGEDDDYQKLIVRFRLYCQCAKCCERLDFKDDLIYFMMVLARAIKLFMKTKKINFLKCFYTNYIRG